MDELFKALPRDLQWEILSDFVGTHVVRNGKLMRKLGNKIKDRLKETSDICSKELWLKPLLVLYYPKEHIYDNIYTIGCAWFNSGIFMKICEDSDTGEIMYFYSNQLICKYTKTPQIDIISVLDDSVILPPFVKHYYPHNHF